MNSGPVRDAHAARCGYDVEKIFRDIRATQQASGREYVRLPARRVRSDAEDSGDALMQTAPRQTTADVADSRAAPEVGNRDRRRSAHPRDRAVPAGTTSAPAGRDDGRDARCPSRTLGLQGVVARAGRSSSTTGSAARPRAWSVGLAGDGRPRVQRLARPAAPRHSAPAVAARPGRPSRRWRTGVATQVRETPGRGARRRAVDVFCSAAASTTCRTRDSWNSRSPPGRPPPGGSRHLCRLSRRAGGELARRRVADAPSAPGESLAAVLATCHPPRWRPKAAAGRETSPGRETGGGGGCGLTGCPQSDACSRSAAWNSSSKVPPSARSPAGGFDAEPRRLPSSSSLPCCGGR